MAIRATEVFTPGAYPTHTYVPRAEDALEGNLKDALETKGVIASLSGPSKAGKTVLVERVVGRDLLIPIPGAGVRTPADIWERVLDWMDVPASTSRGSSVGGAVSAELETGGGIGIPGLVKIDGKASGRVEVEGAREKASGYDRRGLTQVVEEISGSGFVVLIDDFHYMPREVQVETAKSIKEAVRQGVKIVTAAVPHRGDDVVRANPELRGRVNAIDLTYWKVPELKSIAYAGFKALNLEIEESAVGRFATEAAGSPQLMQSICLNACFALNLREKQDAMRRVAVPDVTVRAIFEQTTASTDFRSLVDVLDAGPKTRGTERKIYRFHDGSEGDVYRCVLKAIAADPPRLSFSYDELTRRTGSACIGEVPVGSSVIGTCLHMGRLAVETFPEERVIDWDNAKLILDIPDPYLLFYLRWSGRLMEEEK